MIETQSMRFLRPYQIYKAGQVVDVAKGLGRSLELARIATRLAPEPQMLFSVASRLNVERTETPIAKQRRQKK